MVSSVSSSAPTVAAKALTSQPATNALTGQTPSVTGSALLGTNSSTNPSATILNGSSGDGSDIFGTLSSTQSTLFQQIQANANARLNTQLQQIGDAADGKIKGLNVEADRWVSVKAQINNAQIYVENGQEAANQVSQILLNMRTSIASSAEQGQDPKYWNDQFNQQVNSINLQAESGSQATNLVGSLNPVDLSPNQIEYRSNVGIGSTTLTGTYIGTDFRITANDGTVWVPDTQSDLIQAYKGLQGEAKTYTTADGQKINMATSTRNGLKLVSYNDKTKAITVQITVVPEEPPITVTGKLETNGIGVMQSWFYNNFATKADRDHAFADINKAETNLVGAQGTLAGLAAQVGRDAKKANDAINDFSKQITDATNSKSQAEQNAKVAAAQQYLAMQSNLQNLQSVQSNYLQAFSGFVDDPFAQASLDLIT
ncbi:MAG: hypothetical protein K1X51_09100 [Rhodospirillaceae bacterium]|nr:hypothetical protein [Rhodospirillaceae bacterium]